MAGSSLSDHAGVGTWSESDAGVCFTLDCLMSLVSVDDDNNDIIEQKLTALIIEKEALNKELEAYTAHDKSNSESRISDIIRLADILENQPLVFNDDLIRQMLQCVVVQSKDCIKIIFNDGTEVDQPIK